MLPPSSDGTGAGPVVMRNSVFWLPDMAAPDPAPPAPTSPVAAPSARLTVPGRWCRSWKACESYANKEE
jgi:hypothetical protein